LWPWPWIRSYGWYNSCITHSSTS